MTSLFRKARKLLTGNRDTEIAKQTSLITYGMDLNNPRALVHRANKRAVSGDVNGALHDLSAAIQLNPAKAITYFNRGCLYNTVGMFGEAVADFDVVIEHLPNYDEAYYQRANSQFKMGNWQGAIEDYGQAIKINPFCIKAYYKRADSRLELGDTQGALADYTQVTLRHPNDANAYYQRGLYRTKTRELHSAIEDFTAAIERNSRHAEAYFNRGYCLAQTGEREQAEQDFNQALLHAPSKQDIYYSRAYALGMLTGPPAILPAESHSLQRVGTANIEDIDRVSAPVTAISPDDSEHQMGLEGPVHAVAASHSDSTFEDTITIEVSPLQDTAPIPSETVGIRTTSAGDLTDVLEDHQDETEVEIDQIGVTLVGANEPTDNAIDIASDSQEETVETYFERARQRYINGDFEGAISDYTQIIECDPQNAQAYYQRGQIRSALGENEVAIRDLDQACHWAQVQSLASKSTANDAPERLSAVHDEANPTSIEDGHGLEHTLAADIDRHSQALKLNPNDTQAHFERARRRALMGDLEGAIEDYTRTVELEPEHSNAYHNRGRCYAALGQTVKATADFNRAIRLKSILPSDAELPVRDPSSSSNSMKDQLPATDSSQDKLSAAESSQDKLLAEKDVTIVTSPSAGTTNPPPMTVQPNVPNQANILQAEVFYNQGVACAKQGDKQGSLTALAEASGLFLRQRQMKRYQEVMALMRTVSKG